ncbi:hypothetical protein [Endozoicomonas sp. 4G]|uniref:hypothetical protein n=1 Tax=Endozoicomonas sp. 4G TaxID=2872754 RepID=UPI00207882D8|nr:hypothetical protein [Endozoicomonas sp. 4G]
MTLQYAFKGLLVSVFFLLCQQALANDTYDLEEFRQHYKKNEEPPSKKRKNSAQASISSPFNNIRIGFFGLNLTDDDVSGDDRLETHDNFVIDPQNIEYLTDFYWHYVNTGDPQYQRARTLQVLRLIFRIYTINMTTSTSPENQEKIKAMVTGLYEQAFLSENNQSNPYYVIIDPDQEENQTDFSNTNKSLVLMLFAFLGPYAFPFNSFPYYSDLLINRVTLSSYHQALPNLLMSGDMDNFESPQHFANQLTAANLNTETALLLVLSSMANATQHCMDFNQSWPETLEELLQNFLPPNVLITIYEKMCILCHRPLRPLPKATHNNQCKLEFINHILGTNLRPPTKLVEKGDSSSEAASDQSCHSSQDGESFQDNYFPQDFSSDDSSDNQGAANETTQEAGAVGGVISRDLGMYFSHKDQ